MMQPLSPPGSREGLTPVLFNGTIHIMKRKNQRTLELIFTRPVSGSVRWDDVVALFLELGAEITEREGSRVAVKLFGDRRVFHRPHPSPNVDKGAVAAIRRWLEANRVKP